MLPILHENKLQNGEIRKLFLIFEFSHFPILNFNLLDF